MKKFATAAVIGLVAGLVAGEAFGQMPWRWRKRVEAAEGVTYTVEQRVAALEALAESLVDAQAGRTNAVDGLVGTATVHVGGASQTQAVVTVTLKDVYGETLPRALAFPAWFTGAGTQTLPSTNGIALFYLTKGSVRAYRNTALSGYDVDVITEYVMETDADGTFAMTVQSEKAGWTNRFCAITPDGVFSSTVVEYVAQE